MFYRQTPPTLSPRSKTTKFSYPRTRRREATESPLKPAPTTTQKPCSLRRSHELFERIQPTLNNGVASPRKFEDYEVEVRDDLPEGVTLTRLAG